LVPGIRIHRVEAGAAIDPAAAGHGISTENETDGE
jgi:hypothetical protein